MYADNITHVVDITAPDTFVKIDDDLSIGEISGVVFQNDCELKITVVGKYLINYSISALTASVANKTVESCIMLNGTPLESSTAHAEVSPGGSNRPEVLSGHAILDLDVDDVISLAMANHDDTTDIVIAHVTCTLVQISR
jgi:hypothetical protein